MSNLPNKPGRKPKQAGVIAPAPDFSFIPQDMLTKFTEENALSLLHLLYRNAHNDTLTAMWLTEKMFGTGGWHRPVLAATNPEVSAGALEAAIERALDAYVAGKVDAQCVGLLTRLLTARLASKNGAETAKVLPSVQEIR